MSDLQSIAYSKIHEYLLDRHPSVDSYNDRIIAQKIGYLIQSAGIYIGDIKFFWHKRGPYSRVLTSLIFSIDNNKESILEQCESFTLKEELKPRLNVVKKIIDSRPKNCPEIFWLEICASLKFINEEHADIGRENVKDILLKRKPFLSTYSKDIDQASLLIL